jgi:hypothetical protein
MRAWRAISRSLGESSVVSPVLISPARSFTHAEDHRRRPGVPGWRHASAWRADNDYVAEIYGAVAIANTIAFISEAIDPISIVISLTRRGLSQTDFYS